MKLAEFLKKYNDFVKRYEDLLYRPIFTVKKSKLIIKGLTYRKVNAWDSKDLLSSFREKKDTGWRKFSIIDTAKLNIISDLRKKGFPIERIKPVMERFAGGNIGLWSPKENKVQRLRLRTVEDFVIACLFGVRMFLIIREREETFFLSETGARSFYSCSDNAFITLPFFSYIKKTASVLKNELGVGRNSTVAELFDGMLPYQEERISRWIRNRNYKEIVFEKSEREKTIINATQKKNVKSYTKDILKAIDSGDYYNIVITTRRGQKIKIVRKEWMKKI